ncbi:MAG: MATE family efflux transporter [Bacteroidetes bacterium]|nr:MATE family efflux transporter [Bacteroidota bacterium]
MNTYLRDILKLSWPIIIGQIGIVLTGFFDSLMVGYLGHEELAAAGISNSIYFLVAVFPLGVTISYSTIVSMLQGKNKTSSYSIVARDCFLMTLALSAVASLVILGVIYNFGMFKQTDVVAQLSIPYLKLLLWSLTPMLFFLFSKQLCDGFGYTKGGMIITLIALLINIFFNWLLIYGHWGFQAYGLNGAGYATIISRIFLAIAMTSLLFKSKQTPIRYQNFINSFKRPSRIYFYKQIITLGFPSGLQYFFEVAAFAAAAIMAGWIGAKELAAHNLAITLASLTYMIASGISAGSSICTAKAYGNGNRHNMRQYGIMGHKLGIGVMLFFALLFFVFNHQLASLFTQEPEVILMGSQLLILAAIFQLGDGLQALSVGLLRGINDVSIPSLLIFIAYWIIAMPIGYTLSHSTNTYSFLQGVNGIWIGLSIGLTLSAIVLTSRFYYLLRKS